jgi:hypothetical protein
VHSGGYENTDYYRGSTISFNDIPNIHAVRTSYQNLFKLCNLYSEFCNELTPEAIKKLDESYFSKLEKTGWL